MNKPLKNIKAADENRRLFLITSCDIYEFCGKNGARKYVPRMAQSNADKEMKNQIKVQVSDPSIPQGKLHDDAMKNKSR